MFHDPIEYEIRAAECERLARITKDPILREDILSLSRIYLDYAAHLHRRAESSDCSAGARWPEAASA